MNWASFIDALFSSKGDEKKFSMVAIEISTGDIVLMGNSFFILVIA